MTAAAIFDLDGTLVSFRFDVVGARRALLAELSGSGLSTQGLDLSTPIQQMVDSALRQSVSGGGAPGLEVRKRMYAILDELEAEGSASASLLPGVREVLELLRAKGVRLVILTNSGRKAATKVMTEVGVTQFFEFVLTRDDTEAMKPRPDGLAKAVAALGLRPGAVCYVGDGVYDVVAAKRAGIRVISVATGNYSADSLRESGAEDVIASLSELPRVLGL